MNILKFGLAAATLVAATVLLAGPASAYQIVQTGGFANGNPCDLPGESSQPHCDMYEVAGLMADDVVHLTWDYVGPNDVVDVDAWLTVLSIVDDTMTIELRLTNNSVAGNGDPAAITSFGLTTGAETLDQAATGFATGGEGAVFDELAVDDRRESKLAGVVLDLCVFGVGCSGGTVNEGLAGGGTTDTLTIELVASDGLYDLGATLGTFLIKYQGVDSFELPDLPVEITSLGDDPEPDSLADVPEPASLAILVVGLVGLAAVRLTKAAPRC